MNLWLMTKHIFMQIILISYLKTFGGGGVRDIILLVRCGPRPIFGSFNLWILNDWIFKRHWDPDLSPLLICPSKDDFVNVKSFNLSSYVQKFDNTRPTDGRRRRRRHSRITKNNSLYLTHFDTPPTSFLAEYISILSVAALTIVTT